MLSNSFSNASIDHETRRANVLARLRSMIARKCNRKRFSLAVSVFKREIFSIKMWEIQPRIRMLVWTSAPDIRATITPWIDEWKISGKIIWFEFSFLGIIREYHRKILKKSNQYYRIVINRRTLNGTLRSKHISGWLWTAALHDFALSEWI